ncbi:MAG: MFS transporter [Acidocella sp.]|nr:MFS transporter [Acidocella sp.]
MPEEFNMPKFGASGPVVIRSPLDVSAFINSQPTRPFAILIVLVALGGVFVDAYDFTSIGIGVVQLKQDFQLTPFEVGSITAMMAVGALFGALVGGHFTDKIGRLKMFLLDLVLLVFSAIGAALSFNLEMLLIFRLLMGIGVGLDFPVALSFIAEFMAERNKGASVNLWQATWFVAAICSGIVILPFYFAGLQDVLWRIAVGFGAVPALIVLALRYRFMNESPLWAARNVSLNEAARILEKTYHVPVTVSAPETPTASPPARSFLSLYSELFTPQYRNRTFLISIICMTQSLEYFAIGFNLPIISTQLFGSKFLFAILGSMFFNLFGIAGGASNALVTSRLGTRNIATIGYLVVVVALLSLYFSGPNAPIILEAGLIALFLLGHSFGPGSQGMTMAALSYPTRMRGLGTGWGQGMVRVGSILGFYFFPLVVHWIGFRDMTLALAIVPAAGLLTTVMVRWEPVGHDPDEHDDSLLDALPALAEDNYA